MVSGVASPCVITDDSCSAIGVLLDGPDTEWSILPNFIKEVSLEDGIIILKLLLLGLILHIPKVRILVQLEAVLRVKAPEANVALDLMILSHAESTMRHDVTVVLNGEHGVKESVLLNQVAWLEASVLILRWSILKWVKLLLLLSWSLLLLCFVALNLLVDESGISSELAIKGVIKFLVLGVQLSELAESHVT